ncbi:MAG: sulfotransferase family protein [Sphingomicrobium sp.]
MSQPVLSLSGGYRALIEKPIFIVSSPRSGSTLLFETLAKGPGLFTIGGESHRVIEDVPALSMPARNWGSNRLEAKDATAELAEQLARNFYSVLHDRDGQPANGSARMLEKTPKNALRVPFFDAIWPGAEFVFLYRDVRQTLASMIEAWTSGYFRTYPRLPGWTGLQWSMLLVPGWQRLNGLPLPQIVAHQWATTIDLLVEDLKRLPGGRVHAIDYDSFLADPSRAVAGLSRAIGIDWDVPLDTLPFSKTTVSMPSADKWRRYEREIEALWPIVAEADSRARAFAESRSIAPKDP